ncbi:MFS transporter [Paenibacillus ihbetae]|uniref:MFS transporter n=1 Tax=Paenibacillus ihbetae TaxID=1870820 RepID=A0ABX3JRA4_9BACL|nr:MFS transporter [Paenibacillus ihbetae]OOC59367.1 MFS transporter [Paenibacillus ihbetae]
MNHSININVWKLLAIRFFYSLIPAYVIERLYWEDRGMTIPMVVYAEIIYAVTIVLLEVPSGMMADRWGRKTMMLVSALMGCAEFLLLLFAEAFWHFALVVVVAAIGGAASSGAEQALLYESLRERGRERSFEKWLGRLNAVDIASTVLAALCGSLLASRLPYEFNYALSLISMLVCLGLTLTLTEAGTVGDGEDRPIPIRTYLTASWRLFRENRGLLLVMLSGMVTGAAVNFIDEFWQTYLERVEVPVLYFGLFSAGIFLLRLPGNLLAFALKERFSYRPLLTLVIGVLAACFFWLAAMRDSRSIAALFVISLFAGLVEPLAAGYLQHRADSRMRATMGSFQSLGEKAVLIAIGLGFGYFSSKFDVFGGYGFIAVICAVYALYFLTASRKAV